LEAEGKKLDQDETFDYIQSYLRNLGVEEYIQVNFKQN
jgi:hypothetical protein